MKNKDKTFFSLYFGVFAVATGFLPFAALSLLFSASKCNLAGSGVSAIGKIGKNVLTPALSNALPVAGLAISALDLLAKDDNSKSSNNSSKSINFDYNQTFPKTDYSYITKENYSLFNSIKPKSYYSETPKIDYSYLINCSEKEKSSYLNSIKPKSYYNDYKSILD
ncbi:hypothetical protein ES705_43214 [subsurface metagenome]